MPVNDRDLGALVYLAGRLREDTHGAGTWDTHGTEVVFARELRGTNLRIALEEIIAHASDPHAKTPAAINRGFKPAPASPAARRVYPPKKTDECARHPGQWADNCGGCKADQAAGDLTPEPGDVSGVDHKAHASACRELMRGGAA